MSTLNMAAMQTFNQLGALLTGTPEDIVSAWRDAGQLFAKLVEERENGILWDQLAFERDGNTEEELIFQIREALAAEGKAATDYVIFPAMDYDNGSFLSSGAEIFIDGEAEEFEFPDSVEESMTDRYGCVGNDAGLGLHLRTETLEFDDYIGNVRDSMALLNK